MALFFYVDNFFWWGEKLVLYLFSKFKIMSKLPKPKFYKSVLVEIKGNVLDEVYPQFIGEEQLTMTERMGSDEAKCPDCSNNEWWLLPGDSVAVREGGKQYIECLNCGLHTHL